MIAFVCSWILLLLFSRLFFFYLEKMYWVDSNKLEKYHIMQFRRKRLSLIHQYFLKDFQLECDFVSKGLYITLLFFYHHIIYKHYRQSIKSFLRAIGTTFFLSVSLLSLFPFVRSILESTK